MKKFLKSFNFVSSLFVFLLIFSSPYSSAANINWPTPIYLYTLINESYFDGPNGAACKVIVMQDVYLYGRPVVRTAMICVG